MNLSDDKYKSGDILIFVGESNKFKKNQKYEISKVSTVDYFVDELDSDYGKRCIHFHDSIYGCYYEYADENFEHLDTNRDNKLNNLLNES